MENQEPNYEKGQESRYEYAVINIGPKVPVSLRLPQSLIDKVSEYATQNELRMTDAYIHFIKLGIESEVTGMPSGNKMLAQVAHDASRAVTLLEELKAALQ